MIQLILVLKATLVVAVFAQGSTTNDNCYRYDVDGCSIPFQLPFFFKELFTPSCARHDICYHCGLAKFIPRETCDLSFRKDLIASCKSRYLNPEQGGGFLSRLPFFGRSSSTKQRLVEVVDDHQDELTGLLEEDLRSFNSSDPNPSVSGYLAFFSLRVTKVLIEWIGSMRSDLSKLMTRGGGVSRKRRFLVDDVFYVKGVAEKLFCGTVYATTSLLGVSLDCQDIGYMACYAFSEVYYLGVHGFGGPNYLINPAFYCNEDFVPKCLPGSSK